MRITPRKPHENGRDYALRTLEDNIIHLGLEPGSRVSENELAQELGLSRTPVREALIELSKVDIVQIIPQKGSIIALIDPKLVEQAYFMRSTLECEAIGIAVDNATNEDIASLEANLGDQVRYTQIGASMGVSFMELDNRFHEKIFSMAEKPMVFRIIQELAIHFDRIRHMTIDYMSPPEIVSQHRSILDAMKARDRKEAATLMRVHIGKFRLIEEELRSKYPTYFI